MAAPGIGEFVLHYIVRHWRGELSLAKSFWINCIILSVVYGGVFYGMLYAASTLESAILSMIAVLGYWLIYAPLGIWQVVGTWRAARRYRELKNLPKLPWYKVTFKPRWDRGAQYFLIMMTFGMVQDVCDRGLWEVSEVLNPSQETTSTEEAPALD